MRMQLLSVNVAQPKWVQIEDKEVLTGIYKEPVDGKVSLRLLGLDGDGQADLAVHGGVHQAVYVYPLEHYEFWGGKLSRSRLPFGTFGENLTTTGLVESEVCIGDTFQVGATLLQVTAPRLPCFKFAHKIGRPDLLKEFLHSGHSGFYCRVLEEGAVAAGDVITLMNRAKHGITVRMALGLQVLGEGDAELLQRGLSIENLNPILIRDYTARLAKMAAE